MGSRPLVAVKVDGRKLQPRALAKAFGPTGWFKTFRVTPSLVTEWACKACAYVHARFNSAVTHQPPADFAIANEIR
jgi:hypothetical protein